MERAGDVSSARTQKGGPHGVTPDCTDLSSADYFSSVIFSTPVKDPDVIL